VHVVPCDDGAKGWWVKSELQKKAPATLGAEENFNLYYGDTVVDPPLATHLVDVLKRLDSSLPVGIAKVDGVLHLFAVVKPVAGACVVCVKGDE
jgi:hypothetical protein